MQVTRVLHRGRGRRGEPCSRTIRYLSSAHRIAPYAIPYCTAQAAISGPLFAEIASGIRYRSTRQLDSRAYQAQTRSQRRRVPAPGGSIRSSHTLGQYRTWRSKSVGTVYAMSVPDTAYGGATWEVETSNVSAESELCTTPASCSASW
eukprot:911420-Rhodomonas_salina.3